MSSPMQRLKSVSRSMYLSFVVLPAAIRVPMGVAYMLCRTADTLADGTAQDVGTRQKTLREFVSLFQRFPFDGKRARTFSDEFLNVDFTDVAADQQLVNHLPESFEWFTALPLTDQALIGEVINDVVRGMEMDLKVFKEASGAPSALTTDQDLESYLRWIGGGPGEFWSKMTLAHIPLSHHERCETWVQNGILFGTGLQLVNILRDLPADLKRGRCYIPLERLAKYGLNLTDICANDDSSQIIPDRIEDTFRTLYVDLVEQARIRLLAGVSYLDGLPFNQWGLRAAVAWPLLIGLETLKRLREARTILNAEERIKISRKEVKTLLVTTAPLIPFQRWIDRKARSIR